MWFDVSRTSFYHVQGKSKFTCNIDIYNRTSIPDICKVVKPSINKAKL